MSKEEWEQRQLMITNKEFAEINELIAFEFDWMLCINEISLELYQKSMQTQNAWKLND